eukprot:3550909-Prymnesium_polylepis.2
MDRASRCGDIRDSRLPQFSGFVLVDLFAFGNCEERSLRKKTPIGAVEAAVHRPGSLAECKTIFPGAFRAQYGYHPSEARVEHPLSTNTAKERSGLLLSKRSRPATAVSDATQTAHRL